MSALVLQDPPGKRRVDFLYLLDSICNRIHEKTKAGNKKDGETAAAYKTMIEGAISRIVKAASEGDEGLKKCTKVCIHSYKGTVVIHPE